MGVWFCANLMLYSASPEMPSAMKEALRANASIGEVCGVLRDEWGEFQESL